MLKLTKTLALAFLSVSAATQVLAEQTMTNLNQSAQAILSQISASQILTAGAVQAAGSGDILNTGVMQTASISDSMQNSYNNAIQAVIDANYYGSHELFMDKHEEAMQNLSASVDNLVDATLVLATAAAVADMAAAADTVPEQQAMQAMLENSPELAVTDAEQGNYNNALASVQEYAREAGAFLAAANNTMLTSTVDNYAANANVNLYNGFAAYSATADILNVAAGDTFGIGFMGFMAGNGVSAEDIYSAGYGS
jgi:hypothetical protein